MKKDSDKDSPEESGEVAREQKGQDKEETRGGRHDHLIDPTAMALRRELRRSPRGN